MARSNYADYLKRAVDYPDQRIIHYKSSTAASSSAYWFSTWTVGPSSNYLPTIGTAPTVPVACDRATAGAIGQQNPLVGPQRLGRIHMNCAGLMAGFFVLCDRLSHSGGLSGIVTTAQTTNLPTAALTRNTSGAGVIAAAEIYTAVGATATEITVSYTNSAGVAGRTSKATTFGGSGNNAVGRLIWLPNDSGDSGVRSVQSVTLAATTGTAGNFGITLLKPLLYVPVTNPGNMAFDVDPVLDLAHSPEIPNDSCLFWIHQQTAAFLGAFEAEYSIIED